MLEKEGVGCYWRHYYTGAVCYADDVVLLAPSPSALRHMLKTCTHIAQSHSNSILWCLTLLNLSWFISLVCAQCPLLFHCQLLCSLATLTVSTTATHLGRFDLSDDDDFTDVKKDHDKES